MATEARVTMSVMFTDIVGFTAMSSQRGDEVAREILRTHDDILGRTVERAGGRVIKSTGDGSLVVFSSVRDALTAAVAAQHEVAAHAVTDPDRAFRIRIGINAGEVTERDGDVFGETVNLAARITDRAAGDEIIVSRVVKDLAGTMQGLVMEDRGDAELKGYADPWRLFAVTSEDKQVVELRVKLLGDTDVRMRDARVDAFDTGRLRSLLAYLILHHETPVQRQRLAFALWPDSTEAQARTNLRQLLHHLRRALPDADRFLDTEGRTIRWRRDAPCWVDASAFERAAAQGLEAGDLDALERAASLYAGELLPGAYDEWLLPERERIRQLAVEVLERLTEAADAAQDPRRGIRHAEALLRLDPLHEATYRRLMALHAAGGERARALRVYHTCVSVLERELGVAPSPATQEAYQALLEGQPSEAAASRTPTARQPTVAGASLVGRSEEWKAAVAAWERTAAGRAQMLLVRGDPGIGKSRLVEELQIWAARNGVGTAKSRSYAAEGRLPYAPVVEWLRSEAFAPSAAKLDPAWRREIAPLLPELSSGGADPPAARGAEGAERARLFEALARAIATMDRPALLVLDDLQWTDPETLEFLHYLLRGSGERRLLIAGTARDEEVGPAHPLTPVLAALRGEDRLVEIRLGPMSPDDTARLAALLFDQPIDASQAEHLYRETEGNPLFVVETVRAGLPAVETLRAPGAAAALPPKVQSVIESRLAQLSPAASELINVAAVVGRAFSFDVLAEVAGLEEDDLVLALDELWQRRIVREQGADAYDFSHDKIRDVAYARLGPARRRQLHLAVARALERVHASDLDAAAASLAGHYERAGVPEQAIQAYQQAADQALRLYANEEVVSHLTKARTLVHRLPASEQRDRLELELLVPLGVSLVAVKGYGARDAVEVYERARALCIRLGEPVTGPILRGLALWALVGLHLDRSTQLGEEILALSSGDGEDVYAVEGNYVIGVSRFWLGDHEISREHLERAIASYRPEHHREHVDLFAQDPKVVCLCRLALTEWYLGRWDVAERLRDESIAMAKELGHPFSTGYALMFSTVLTIEFGDIDLQERLATELRALSDDRPMAYWAAASEVLLGWVEAQRGSLLDGARRLRAGLAMYEEISNLVHTSHALTLLARVEAAAGRITDAHLALDESFRMVTSNSQRYLLPELHRVRAELLIAADDEPSRIEAELDQGTAVATEQRAAGKLLQLGLTRVRWRRAAGLADASDAEHLRALLAAISGSSADTRETEDLIAGL